VFLIGLFITSGEVPFAVKSGTGADGHVCDFHYSADLLAQRGSALYDQLDASGAVAKDMFYHDWNLASIGPTRAAAARGNDLPVGPQRGRKTFAHLVRDADWAALRGLFSSDPVSRHVWRRNMGVLAERLACTTRADVRRYLVAHDERRPLPERQAAITGSVLNEAMVVQLAGARKWRAPLSLRCGS
jgi:anaerobic magnesium-protoporphyrin IX monomethyl ester cyclase